MCSFLKARDVVKNLIWTEGKQNDFLEFTLKMAPRLSGIQTLARIVTFVVGLQPATESRVPPAECGQIKFLCGLRRNRGSEQVRSLPRRARGDTAELEFETRWVYIIITVPCGLKSQK